MYQGASRRLLLYFILRQAQDEDDVKCPPLGGERG